MSHTMEQCETDTIAEPDGPVALTEVPGGAIPGSGLTGFRRSIARSDDPRIRALKRAYRSIERFSIPAPRLIYAPLLFTYVCARTVLHWCTRVFLCEPLLKVQCKSYGRGLHSSIYMHWIRGKGDIILGDYVTLDGRIGINFAARYSDRPTLRIGDRSRIGNGGGISVAKSITIGRCCRISTDVLMFDSSGHASDPARRLSGAPADDADVKPIVIEDNAWIGRRCTIFPGVTVGTGSIVASGSVVMGDVPPYTVVAGNPARKIGSLVPADPDAVDREIERTRLGMN